MRNALLRVLGWFAALPYLFVLVLVVTGPPTWSGLLYVLAMGAMVFGLATLPRLDDDGNPVPTRRPRGITRGGAAVIAAVAFIRCFTASGGGTMTMTDAHGGSARIAGRLVDEGDVAIAGTRVLVASGMLRDDAAELPSAMRTAYADLRREEGDLPTPFVGTYLGLQRAHAFDLLVVEPREPGPRRDDAAVVFLHGYAGNFDLPCWQIARAVGILTACPSARWVGDWWTADGEAAVARTVEILHARGVTKIVLAGLSNGGYGASQLAPRMRGKFTALVLISGADADAASPGVPTLVIHGYADEMASLDEATAYAAKHHARFVGLRAGHFAMLVKREESDRAVRDFVRAQIGAPLTAAAGSRAGAHARARE